MKEKELEAPYQLARQKLLLNGAESLSGKELLLVVTQSSSRESSEAINQLLERYGGDLSCLGGAPTEVFERLKGVSSKGIASLISAIELSKRIHPTPQERSDIIACNADVVALFYPIFKPLQHEELWILYLTGSNSIIDKSRINHGGTQMASVDIRLIFKQAIEKLATSILMVHNHPSGAAVPGNYDKELTAKIEEGCRVFDLRLLDHIIISPNDNYSFREKGLLL